MSIIATKYNIVEGTHVMRGRDWKWDNQDGGPGKKGTVISVGPNSRCSPGWCAVKWDDPKAHTSCHYRIGDTYGTDPKYDLYLYEEPVPAAKPRLTSDKAIVGAKVILDMTNCSHVARGLLEEDKVYEISNYLLGVIGLKGKEGIQRLHISNFLLVEEAPKVPVVIPVPEPAFIDYTNWVSLPENIATEGLKVMIDPKTHMDSDLKKGELGKVYTIKSAGKMNGTQSVLVTLDELAGGGWYCERFLVHKKDLEAIKAVKQPVDNSIPSYVEDWVPLHMKDAKVGARIRLAKGQYASGLEHDREYTIGYFDKEFIYPLGQDLSKRGGSGWCATRFIVHKNDIKPDPVTYTLPPKPTINLSDWTKLTMENVQVGARVILDVKYSSGTEGYITKDTIYKVKKIDRTGSGSIYLEIESWKLSLGWFPHRFLINRADVASSNPADPNDYQKGIDNAALQALRGSLSQIGKQDSSLFKTPNKGYEHTKHSDSDRGIKVRRPISTIEGPKGRSRALDPGRRSRTRSRICYNQPETSNPQYYPEIAGCQMQISS